MRRLTAAASALKSRVTDDRGAVLVITALGLVMFMAFAAVAVDLSHLFTVRRHAQTAVDVGVLAGAQSAGVNADASIAKLVVIQEIKDITATNVPTADWGSCVDTGRPAEFTPVAGETDCISFTIGLSKIRVRLPDQTFDTLFAGVIGVDTLTTHAVAEAEALVLENGDILPFGIPSGAADSTVGCPSDHPDGVAPCDGPDAGNFNHLAMPQWGISPPPDTDCTHSTGAYEDNIADGIDHLLGIYDNPDNTIIDDKPTCEAGILNIANPPGTVLAYTGVANSTLVHGLLTGSPQFPGRLTDTSVSTETTSVIGLTVDNTPLWAFIGNYPAGADISGIPDSCQGPSFVGTGDSDWDEDIWVEAGLDPVTADPDYKVGSPTSHLEPRASFEHMARCLREFQKGEWDPGTGPMGVPPYFGADYDSGTKGTVAMFTKATNANANPAIGIYDLQLSPRWGWSPVGVFGSGTSLPFQISRFIPIYVNTLVAKGTAATAWTWHGGQAPPPGDPVGDKISSLISFQLPKSSLPDSVFKFGPGNDFETEYTLTR